MTDHPAPIPSPDRDAPEPPGPGDPGRRIHAARRDPARVVLEGLHAVKHALRFGASLEVLVTPDADRLDELVRSLCPDLAPLPATQVPPALWEELTRGGLPSPALGVALRPEVDVGGALAATGGAPMVLLEDPTHLGNVGAAIRVAAAAAAAGVLVTGASDPWHPAAVRGAAGLQFALPVAAVEELPATDRPLVAVDPGGEPLRPGLVPPRAVLAFGTERGGLRPDRLAAADLRIGIPMAPGVSSLNLATSVAIVLYAS